jgi:hypothetical protein
MVSFMFANLQATLEASNGALALPLIKNKKTVNPRDSSTPAVFQLETAMGSGELDIRHLLLLLLMLPLLLPLQCHGCCCFKDASTP